MANWRVSLNRQHFAVWARVAVWWATLIVMALIFGPHARADELLFAVVGLPLLVLVPYVAGTFILAWAKTMLLPWPSPGWWRRRILSGNRHLSERTGRADRGQV
jgi:hypothetical protein